MFGKYYMRAVITNTVDTDTVATRIQQNASVKKSDVLAVLAELSEVIHEYLIDGKAVKLDGIGTFKVAISSEGSVSASEATSAKIKNERVNFMPETKVQGGHRTKAMIADITWKEQGDYTRPKDEVEP